MARHVTEVPVGGGDVDRAGIACHPHVFRMIRALIFGVVLLVAAPRLDAQEIYQAVVLDLAVLEVQVIVVGARGGEQVRCLLRDRTGRVRVGGVQSVSAGMKSGRSTLLSIPLPLLNPTESEFAVALVRGDTLVTQTEWRPLFRSPERGAPP